MNNQEQEILKTRRKIKWLIWFFITGLILSGITAFPLEWELTILKNLTASHLQEESGLSLWIEKVHEALEVTYAKYPFMAYGTDWLAFAHLIIALSFWGPLKDPVKNIWIIEFGMLACILVIPLALIAGAVREIPFYWRIIDCAFGVIGIIPLSYSYQLIRKLKKLKEEKQ